MRRSTSSTEDILKKSSSSGDPPLKLWRSLQTLGCSTIYFGSRTLSTRISERASFTASMRPLNRAGRLKSYVICFTDDGLEDAKALPKNVRNHLKKEILRRIGKDPIACSEELKPPIEKFRSCHIGDYRVVFYVAEDVRSVAIAGIGKHSKEAARDVYKKLESLVSQGKLAEKILKTLRG